MIYFESMLDGPDTMLNCKPLKQLVSCEYKGVTYIFTSVARARRWAETDVFQNYTGLPDRHAGQEGGWREHPANLNTLRDEDNEHY